MIWQNKIMKKKGIAVYVRVSTGRQDLENQVPDLKRWLAVHGKGKRASWYRDKFTGRSFKRPGWEKLEAAVRAGKVGTILVWAVDRLGRTNLEMLHLYEDLEARDVRFVSVQDPAWSNTINMSSSHRKTTC